MDGKSKQMKEECFGLFFSLRYGLDLIINQDLS